MQQQKKIIAALESFIKNPSKGLPEDIFFFVSRITPMINVDLLIKNKKNDTLLTWRNDSFYGPGWHVPGGIIRYKEKIKDRINAVARNELGAKVEFGKKPLAINELMIPPRNRGHFISLLFKCTLTSSLSENLHFKKGTPKQGEWSWHKRCPDNIISVHKIYQKYI